MIGKKIRFGQPPYSFQVHIDDEQAVEQLTRSLTSQLKEVPAHRDIVIVCIGTDRSTGDSLGPLAGTLLSKKRRQRLHVYGTLADPVHALNLESVLEQIAVTHDSPFIIAVDACLGRMKNVGKINVAEGPVHPGSAMKKKLPAVGDMHITAIVNVSGMMEYFVLQNTRLHTVMSMAEHIAESLRKTDLRLRDRTVEPAPAPTKTTKSFFPSPSLEVQPIRKS